MGQVIQFCFRTFRDIGLVTGRARAMEDARASIVNGALSALEREGSTLCSPIWRS
jgi:hypothetical protein